MGLLRPLAGLPLLPIRLVLSLGRVVGEEASKELYSPAAVRRQLEAISAAREAGVLSAEQAARLEHEAVERLIWQPGTGLYALPQQDDEWRS